MAATLQNDALGAAAVPESLDFLAARLVHTEAEALRYLHAVEGSQSAAGGLDALKFTYHVENAPTIYKWMWGISAASALLCLAMWTKHMTSLVLAGLRVRRARHDVFVPAVMMSYARIFSFFPLWGFFWLGGAAGASFHGVVFAAAAPVRGGLPAVVLGANGAPSQRAQQRRAAAASALRAGEAASKVTPLFQAPGYAAKESPARAAT
eukprot:GHVT01031978.1.p1 GENE.GHVT01031978.1~~GHVT01031978.1.p1  ORF type:complete len:208 (-),score=50.65 GHVT01031978.1:347-970(-)